MKKQPIAIHRLTGLGFTLTVACSIAPPPAPINLTSNITVQAPPARILSSRTDTIALFCAGQPTGGDQGYSRALAIEYRKLITLALRAGDLPSQTTPPSIPVPTIEPSPPASSEPPQATSAPTPGATASPIATATPTQDISVVEKTRFNGMVYDDQGRPLDGATVKAQSLSSGIPFEETAVTSGGAYFFHNAPSGISIEIIATKPGFTIRRRVEVLKSNKQNDLRANRFDFGSPTEGPLAPIPTPPPTTSPSPTPTPTPSPPRRTSDFFYFSYDDSASTAAVELTKNALYNQSQPDPAWARPWEFLNYENFDRIGQQPAGLFKVSMGIWKHAAQEVAATENYELGIHVSAPSLCLAERKNVVLTLLVDVSDSMNEAAPLSTDEGRPPPTKLELMKFGLQELVASLKPGDTINLIEFSDRAFVRLEGYSFDPGANRYRESIQQMATLAKTNLSDGINEAYRLATQYFDPAKINRVVILTDAYANQGEVDVRKIAEKTRINNTEGIYFSAIGLGQDFNEGFLNTLTETGKGAYFSIVTKTDARRAFQERFMALISVAARNVRFRLEYPAALKRARSAAEQSSQIAQEVQTTNFSYNTSQYLWEQFQATPTAALGQQKITLDIAYSHPETLQPIREIYQRPLLELLGKDTANIQAAHLIHLLNGLVKGERERGHVQNELATILAGVGEEKP